MKTYSNISFPSKVRFRKKVHSQTSDHVWFFLTRWALTRLQTTFWHCSLTLETTKKRLETRDYKKMRFRRAAAVTFFLGGDAEVLRAGVPHFFLRAARGYVFSLYFGLYHQYYLKSCQQHKHMAHFIKNLNRNKAYTSLYLKNFRAARAKQSRDQRLQLLHIQPSTAPRQVVSRLRTS